MAETKERYIHIGNSVMAKTNSSLMINKSLTRDGWFSQGLCIQDIVRGHGVVFKTSGLLQTMTEVKSC